MKINLSRLTTGQKLAVSLLWIPTGIFWGLLNKAWWAYDVANDAPFWLLPFAVIHLAFLLTFLCAFIVALVVAVMVWVVRDKKGESKDA